MFVIEQEIEGISTLIHKRGIISTKNIQTNALHRWAKMLLRRIYFICIQYEQLKFFF